MTHLAAFMKHNYRCSIERSISEVSFEVGRSLLGDFRNLSKIIRILLRISEDFRRFQRPSELILITAQHKMLRANLEYDLRPGNFARISF